MLLSIAKRDFASKFDLADIVNAILPKFKTGYQWEYLLVEHLFSGRPPNYKSVFHHYRKWCKLGEWEKMFAALVNKYKHLLDLPLSHIDGFHIPAVRGGESVYY